MLQNCFTEHFYPSVKLPCEIKKPEPKVLLLMDNAACIPVEMVFLQPNIITLMQPMDQGIIWIYKACYLWEAFRQIFKKQTIN